MKIACTLKRRLKIPGADLYLGRARDFVDVVVVDVDVTDGAEARAAEAARAYLK